MQTYKTVEDFMSALDSTQEKQVTLLRTIVTNNHPELHEHIKWNSPSYMQNEIDRITFSVRPKRPITLVFHMGATRPEIKGGVPVMNDLSGLIEWKSDTRGIISFTSSDDIERKTGQLTTIIAQWLAIHV